MYFMSALFTKKLFIEFAASALDIFGPKTWLFSKQASDFSKKFQVSTLLVQRIWKLSVLIGLQACRLQHFVRCFPTHSREIFNILTLKPVWWQSTQISNNTKSEIRIFSNSKFNRRECIHCCLSNCHFKIPISISDSENLFLTHITKEIFTPSVSYFCKKISTSWWREEERMMYDGKYWREHKKGRMEIGTIVDGVWVAHVGDFILSYVLDKPLCIEWTWRQGKRTLDVLESVI